ESLLHIYCVSTGIFHASGIDPVVIVFGNGADAEFFVARRSDFSHDQNIQRRFESLRNLKSYGYPASR
ncbi:MAG: hypothetical protein ACXWSC_18555, partial [Bdellovibrionota bacterium]